MSRDTTFESVTIEFMPPQGGKLLNGYIVPIEPFHEGDAPMVSPNTVKFDLPGLPPGATYDLYVSYDGTYRPPIRIRSQGDPVRVVQASLETWFARHELESFVVLFLVWCLVLVAVSFWQKRPVEHGASAQVGSLAVVSALLALWVFGRSKSGEET